MLARHHDPIVAIATAPGRGAVGIVRVSGKGLEALVLRHGKKGQAFIFGDLPSIAEICLIPQMFNARRFDIDLTAFPRLLAIEEKCLELSAFQEAAPDRQPDAA